VSIAHVHLASHLTLPNGGSKFSIHFKMKGGKAHMPHYLLQASYTPEGWEALVKNPQNRFDAIRPAIEKLGGKIEHGWLAFGEYDIVGIFQMPNNVSAAAMAIAFAAGGALKTVKTTPLLSAEEGLEALKKAATSGYRPATTATAHRA
jgi:uncharacterized protein with GYD domain